MKNVHVFKRMSVFSIRSFLLFSLAIFTQAMIGCKSDDVSPQSLSQQAQNLVKDNNLRRVTTLPQSEPILYLISVEQASQFFLGLKSMQFNASKFSNSQLLPPLWASPRAENDMNALGVFTFPDETVAEMDFDKKGNISTLSINSISKTNISYDYDSVCGYLAITKWGIIAVPKTGDLDKFIPIYDYYYAPITRWEASLESAWSRIQHFDIEANLTMEELGKFEVFYTSTLPVIDPPKPAQDKFRGNTANQIVPIQND